MVNKNWNIWRNEFSQFIIKPRYRTSPGCASWWKGRFLPWYPSSQQGYLHSTLKFFSLLRRIFNILNILTIFPYLQSIKQKYCCLYLKWSIVCARGKDKRTFQDTGYRTNMSTIFCRRGNHLLSGAYRGQRQIGREGNSESSNSSIFVLRR